ncbi:hypothetical protein [Rhizomonospora bruguierae]|uniref:hypothetical protein n=1 Tax=Rhizomonospora bruguierae TaxID=1581705 RepID=UPI001BCD025C|nr:hypothetical protein [Micromonospora sp. NBRC 107566]
MRLSVTPEQVPPRVATGAYILSTGLEKWRAGEEQATGLQGAAAQAFPQLKALPPRRFLRLLATAEITLGGALLAPVVPGLLAGTGLAAFAGGLLTMYLRTPALRRPGSVKPSEQGIAISKDVWMLGIGIGLILDDLLAGRRRR